MSARPELVEHCRIYNADSDALHKIAREAAAQANVPAYWTDRNCMDPDEKQLQSDVYDICDIVRGAEALVVIVGESNSEQPSKCDESLLEDWGERMWTWPEGILAKPGKDILVYTRSKNYQMPMRIPRMEFPAKAWPRDRDRAIQLIDHYENNLALTRLELVVLALECLQRRAKSGTTPFFPGDMSYALMGLLRQRPDIDRKDSAFQAFARLSLANDSDKLLERMICILPKDLDEYTGDDKHYWAAIDDYWNVRLWDIDPYCQIAGIGNGDTVVIDGAYAATIHWDSFQRVAITTKETWTRLISRFFLRAAPGYMSLAILGLSLNITSLAAIFLLLTIIVMLLSPMLTLHTYGGKAWNTQPWLFGFEGHMDIKEIESLIFGFHQNRLTWAPYGSSLSKHQRMQGFLDDECRGIDPKRFSDIARKIEESRDADNGKPRIFTIVDTNTM